jgi:hypothetical protein
MKNSTKVLLIAALYDRLQKTFNRVVVRAGHRVYTPCQ